MRLDCTSQRFVEPASSSSWTAGPIRVRFPVLLT